jgi:hypothetical protein
MNGSLLCAGGLVAFLIVFGLIAFLRYLRHKEIIALAEQGLPYPENAGNGKDMLRWGISIVAIGLALIAGVFPMAMQNAWALTLIGLIPLFFGLALLLVYVLTQMENEENKSPEDEEEEITDIIDAIEENMGDC